MVISLERDADLHMAQLMPLLLIVSCFSKIKIGFTFLVPAHPGGPGQRAVKHVCVCCSYLISGDADGKLFVWDWKTQKLYSKFQAHDAVCSSALWHPHETSKVATAGWDGLIKFWD